jgi:OOP family OmpA-OmpF porin
MEEQPAWENIGGDVNTSRSQVAPCFSPDGKLLFFSTGDNVGGFIANGDIYTATLGPDGRWGNVRTETALNNAAHNAVIGVYPGGNSLLLFSDYTGGGALFSVTDRTESGWSPPRPIPIPVPQLTQNVWSGTIGSDGRTIIVDLNVTGRQNESDMFVTFQDASGNWSPLRDMGPELNKPYAWDGTPYLSADMRTLYFNSTRANNGGSDFFVSRRLDDTWTNWSTPEVIPMKMNPYAVVQFFSAPGDGAYAYFISGNKSFGGGDVLRMQLEPRFRPEPFLIVNGVTLDKATGQPVAAKVAFEDLGSATGMGSVMSDQGTGAYQIILPKGRNYGVYSEADGYYSMTANIDATAVSAQGTLKQDLLMVPVTQGQIIPLNNVFFDFAKATLRKESNSELNRVVSFLQEYPTVKIEVAGHTDNVGDDASNLSLSQKRAAAVSAYLTANGIETNRVVSQGYGKTKPVATNDTDAGRQLNRRVEIKLLER